MPKLNKNKIPNIICEGMATIGQRGQIIIPSKLRDKLKIKPHDRFVVFFNEIGAITFIRLNRFDQILNKLGKKIVEIKKFLK